jgi:hypothetical protein
MSEEKAKSVDEEKEESDSSGLPQIADAGKILFSRKREPFCAPTETGYSEQGRPPSGLEAKRRRIVFTRTLLTRGSARSTS